MTIFVGIFFILFLCAIVLISALDVRAQEKHRKSVIKKLDTILSSTVHIEDIVTDDLFLQLDSIEDEVKNLRK